MRALPLLTLPSRPNAVQVWRRLKSLGGVALPDRAYGLPLAQAALAEPRAPHADPGAAP